MDERFANAPNAIRWGAEMILAIVRRELSGVELAEVDDEACRDLASREARWLLEAAAVSAGRDPLFLRHPELSPRVIAVFRSFLARRSRGEPFAYVVGESSFCGRDFIVTSDVLIPRPETEQLVELALEMIPREASWKILEQGIGSGAISVTLAAERPLISVTAVEVSPSAIEIARRNAARHGVEKRIEIIEGDLFPPRSAKPEFDLLVANLPYVADEEELPANVAEWEPRGALRGGPSGREIIERSIAGAREWLKPGGMLLYEIGEEQSRFPGDFSYLKDLSGRNRFITGLLTPEGIRPATVPKT